MRAKTLIINFWTTGTILRSYGKVLKKGNRCRVEPVS